jgi:hypothetical protein
MLALIGGSSDLLIVGYLATVGTLFINSLLFVGILALWLTGVERIAPSKPLMLASVLGAGVVTDVVML